MFDLIDQLDLGDGINADVNQIMKQLQDQIEST